MPKFSKGKPNSVLEGRKEETIDYTQYKEISPREFERIMIDLVISQCRSHNNRKVECTIGR